MTQHELSLMQDTIQEIYDRMGHEMLPEPIYRDLYSQMAGIRRVLYAVGYDVDIDCLGCVTIVKTSR